MTTRRLLVTLAGVVWLACFGAAMFTIIPLGTLGLISVFDGSFTALEKLQGVGFFVLAITTVVALSIALGRVVKISSKVRRA